LKLRYPITIKFAEQGGKVQIPSIDGKKNYSLQIPPNTENLHVFCIKNAGVPKIRESGRGDLFVIVEIYDPRNISSEIQKRLRLLQDR
jgi:molecular chaperone DnaJ